MGVVLGRLLAGGTVGLIAGTVNALYTSSRPTPVELSAAEAWLGMAIGMAVALLSALKPAREAMQVPPTEAMSRGAHEHQARMHWRRGLAWSAVFAGGRAGDARSRRHGTAIPSADTSRRCWRSWRRRWPRPPWCWRSTA